MTRSGAARSDICSGRAYHAHRRSDHLPRRHVDAAKPRIRDPDRRAAAARSRDGRPLLPRVGARQLSGARLRAPRLPPDDHGRARQRPALRAPRQATLPRRRRGPRLPRALPRLRVRAERAHVVPGRQPRLLERHEPLLLHRRRASPPLPRRRRAAAALALARRHAAAARARRAPHLRSRRLRRAGRLPLRGGHARAPHLPRGQHHVRAGAVRPHERRRAASWSRSSAASLLRRARSSAGSRSLATSSSCTRCPRARAGWSTARR